MKLFLPSAGVALLLTGIIWILQGINVLPGSFMTGQSFWTWMGIISFFAGGTLLYMGLKARATG